MTYAVLVLEHPWAELHDDPAQMSVRHFLDGLSRLEGLAVFHTTFFDAGSFGRGLQYLMDARRLKGVDRVIVYVAAHGSGSRIGGESGPGMNLATVFSRIEEFGRGKVAGLILDICDVGLQAETIVTGMAASNIAWVTGFGATIDWLTATSIHLHVLSSMTGLKIAHLNKKKALISALQEAMQVFNPALPIPQDDDDELELALDDELEEEDDDGEEVPLLTLAEVFMALVQTNNKPSVVLQEHEIWPSLA